MDAALANKILDIADMSLGFAKSAASKADCDGFNLIAARLLAAIDKSALEAR